MVPHKTKRGAAALERLKVFEGIPAPYDRVKRLVVPDALQVLRLQHGHRFCKLGDLSTAVRVKTRGGLELLVPLIATSLLFKHRLAGSIRRRSRSSRQNARSSQLHSTQPRSVCWHCAPRLLPRLRQERHRSAAVFDGTVLL